MYREFWVSRSILGLFDDTMKDIRGTSCRSNYRNCRREQRATSSSGIVSHRRKQQRYFGQDNDTPYAGTVNLVPRSRASVCIETHSEALETPLPLAGSSNSQDSFPAAGSSNTSMDGYGTYQSGYAGGTPGGPSSEYTPPPPRPPSQSSAPSAHQGTLSRSSHTSTPEFTSHSLVRFA